ncbi:MAG: hypothetical protein MUF60_07125 [Vicinamibacterales bacterium]|jgi:hypothetical protein|nr:hypothetical protein [Vicinamibacterales bacterium]
MPSHPRRPSCAATVVLPALVAAACLAASTTIARAQEPIRGEAALAHPAVQLAVKAAELIKAGKIDEAMALRTRESQAEWKQMPAEDRRGLGARIATLTPEPTSFAADVRAFGELTINGNSAVLGVETPKRRMAAYFDREDGAWRIANGPIEFPAEPDPASQVRIENEDLLGHPVWPLALEYLDLVHAGRIDEAKRLATSDVQAKWAAEPASEKAESLAFLRKNLPTRAEATEALKGGGDSRAVLIVENDEVATLNVIRTERRQQSPGEMSISSTTMAIGFAKEGGAWKLAQ